MHADQKIADWDEQMSIRLDLRCASQTAQTNRVHQAQASKFAQNDPCGWPPETSQSGSSLIIADRCGP